MQAVLTDQCLIHLHLPRTGGTTLRKLLLPQLLKRISPDQVFLVDNGHEHDCLSGSFTKLVALAPQRRAKLRFISGHMPPTIIDLVPDPVAFTVMRCPVDRALSDYWYCYHTTENPAHAEARRLGPVDFCAMGCSQASNGQARYLSGAAFERVTPSDNDLLLRAQSTLRRLCYSGTFENFKETLEAIAVIAGVTSPNWSGNWNSAERIWPTPRLERTKIADLNRVDAVLYTAASQGQFNVSVGR